MDLNKLHYFYTVAKHQQVTKAAQELYISQPALSKAMKQLEQELGVRLFYKQQRGIRLTPSGEHLRERLENVFSILDRLPGELTLLEKQEESIIRLHVLVASLITTDAIASYKKEHPDVNFQVVQSREAVDCHISINADADHLQTPDILRQQVIHEDIFLAVPKDGPLADRPCIDLQEVREEWFVCASYARPFRRICDSFCMAAGFKPRVTFESDFPSAVRNLISAGASIGFWPAFSFGTPTEDMCLLPIRKPRCSRQLVLRLHKTAAASPVAEAFYEYLAEFLQTKANSR